MALVGCFPLAKYVADECMPTIHYELWCVETATRQNARRNLEETALKIGQVVAEGVATEMNMSDALRRAATASNLVKRDE